MDNIIDFSENTRDKSVGKSVADIVKNIVEIINNNDTETISFDLDFKDLSIRIYKSRNTAKT